jgi:hypothetical protein
MDALSFFGNWASLLGFVLTIFTLKEVVQTKRWAQRKLARANERSRFVRLADRIAALLRMIRRILGTPGLVSDDAWRDELREALAAVESDPSLSLRDRRIMQRSIRGLHVPVKDAEREMVRLRELHVFLTGLESSLTVELAAESEE